MPTHSIAARREKRKAQAARARARRSQSSPKAAKPQKSPRAQTPPPPYPRELARIERAAEVILRSHATGMARYCLFVLALLAEDDLSVSIAQSEIAALVGLTTHSVERPMRALRALGELVTVTGHRGRQPAVYAIVPAGVG